MAISGKQRNSVIKCDRIKMSKIQHLTGCKSESGQLLKNEIDLPIPNLLVVDDDPTVRQQLERLYTQSGYSVVAISSAEEGISRFAEEDIDLAITDIKLPGMDGVQFISYIHENFPDVPVIAITGYSDIQTAVNLLKLGASDLVVKPFDLGAVQESTRAALEKSNVYMEIRHLRRWLKDGSIFGGMLSKTPEMHRVFEIIRMVAPTDMTVLVQGETGTGKELVAIAIHYQSQRRDGPFVTINCAGFPESLLENELFGHEKGAFTGADHPKPGKIELAHGGTLFLDEIESISVVMQGKLLRVLEDQKVHRLGGGASIPVEKGINTISKHVVNVLMDYAWPGNIRELQNILARAIVLAAGPIIDAVDLLDLIPQPQPKENGAILCASLDEWMTEQEKRFLEQKLEDFGGNVALTAKSCGIGLRTLSRKIRLHNLDSKGFQNNKT